MSITNERFFVREPFCGLSHGIGACLSVAALVTLDILARGDIWKIVGFTIYGLSLIALYVISALYHSLWLDLRRLDQLQRLDHIAIFLFIAGTYTPLCLVSLRGTWGWSLLGVVWALACLGIMGSSPKHGFPDWARVVTYAVMGWLAILAVAPLRHALSPTGFSWLLAGGLAYTAGTIIFAADKPHLWPGKFNAHDLWHLFVLGGSVCHFVVMVRFVA